MKSLVYGLLIHLGRNLWSDSDVADHLRCDVGVWNEITEHLAECGGNMLVIDLAEGLAYPSHPELAVRGSWSPERMAEEIARLKAMGIEAIPKLNFSSCHDAWLKDYSRELSTPEYYRVCSDLIRDTANIFGRPRFIHLGWDEEDYPNQKDYPYIAIRQGENWWKDMLFTCEAVRDAGSRPWIWSDREWLFKDEFVKNCPRDVLQSHWYYGPFFGPDRQQRDDSRMAESMKKLGGHVDEHLTLSTYAELEEAGFDQICCGSNYYYLNNFPDMVRHCLKSVSATHLKGFLNAPWHVVDRSDNGIHRGIYLNACDQLAGARGIVRNWCANVA